MDRALRRAQASLPLLDSRHTDHREPLTDEVRDNIMAGYVAVDSLVERGVRALAWGSSKDLLELNALVLFGPDRARRERHAKAIEAARAKFYDEPGAGIGPLADWYARHIGDDPWGRAAGIYVRSLSEPQLFVEGNHRTGALLMSWILVESGEPPFVLDEHNAAGYFDPSLVIKATRRTAYSLLFKLPSIRRKFAEFLRAQADPTLLMRVVGDARSAGATKRASSGT